ncbi:hypothetical protein SKAU_G00401770 [Synaphobranchus kaupii]|uniref:Uncharacterized protein n=1 Tax=Synaphobranchus kaupii TaxID=118154 RepID=A0A9Q1E994_SYNKA|nr:hypothetical protein SKAU_G00401770 [Synaphobranchus kaupii]
MITSAAVPISLLKENENYGNRAIHFHQRNTEIPLTTDELLRPYMSPITEDGCNPTFDHWNEHHSAGYSMLYS